MQIRFLIFFSNNVQLKFYIFHYEITEIIINVKKFREIPYVKFKLLISGSMQVGLAYLRKGEEAKYKFILQIFLATSAVSLD